VGAEALARWTDEDGSAVAPDRFIPLAEECGFVGGITRLALRHVLRDLGELLHDDPGFQVSVNVTAADLSDAGFVPTLETMLTDAGVRAESMTIEITETSTARYERAIETIRLLRAAGHRVHIDDFGTGYSSLAYLQDLSVDAIKIDKIFTQAIGTDSAAVSILPQILAMAEALDLEIVAEGIETEEQAQYFASSEKQIRGQGWLFGRPMPARSLLEMLTEAKEKNPASVSALYSPA
jgi:sensor c-di-GMP phosphodiesterase-like protein